jgi:uncharacterized membrane protein (UPF0127 family)
VINESRGLVLAEHAEVAGSAWRRLRGLLGQPALNQGRGLIILPCLGVHSLGMGYRIDVVHVDRHNLVRAVLHGLRPWSIGPLVWKSHLALEVPAGVAATTLVGDRLAFEPPDRAGLSVYGDDGDLPRGPRGH